MATSTAVPPKKPDKNRAVGRKREREPDPQDVKGQWALWVAYHLPEGTSGKELADVVGKSESLGNKWLAGDSIPNVNLWGKLAVWLGMTNDEDDVEAIWPPLNFVKYVKERGHLPATNRLKRKR